jgi:hypothetical protein
MHKIDFFSNAKCKAIVKKKIQNFYKVCAIIRVIDRQIENCTENTLHKAETQKKYLTEAFF